MAAVGEDGLNDRANPRVEVVYRYGPFGRGIPQKSQTWRSTSTNPTMRHWEFSVRGVRYWLGDHAVDAMEAPEGHELEALLHQWAFEGHGAVLLELLHQLGVGSRVSEDPLALAEQLVQHLDAGMAVLSREPEPELQLEPPPEQVDIAELLPPPSSPPPDADHWIEVVLLDSGEQPIGNERFELVLPDGKVHSGRTDDDGLLRVDPIFKAGNCRLYFPDLQQQLAGSL